jgi:hypothetical protein
MARYTVPLTSWASTAVTVETASTDPQEITRLAEEQVSTSLCHQCAGSRNRYLEIGDEWNAVVNDGEYVFTREDD